jgi:hypothetical protein
MNKTITLDWVEYELVPHYNTIKIADYSKWFYEEKEFAGYLLKPLHWEIDLSDKDTND